MRKARKPYSLRHVIKTASSDALKKYWAEKDKKDGVLTREEYVKPTTFGGHMRYYGDRALKNMASLGRGALAGTGVLATRTAQNFADAATWLPRLADSFIGGRLLGVDEGRGLFGRAYGELERKADSAVDSIRRWSSDYDYKNRINGGFNRMITGAIPDALGGFLGYGGLGALIKKRLAAAAFMGSFGAVPTLFPFSREKQLRDREAWIRSLHPRDRVHIDPTSTPVNQEEAPTLAEYRRYHMPDPSTLPTSLKGYLRIPYSWRHQSNERPVNFRDFGT